MEKESERLRQRHASSAPAAETKQDGHAGHHHGHH
jgi:hypothetical protein